MLRVFRQTNGLEATTPLERRQLHRFSSGGTMRLRRVFGFLALLSLAPLTAWGQGTSIIRGRITDAATGAPLVGVQVRVEGTSIGGLTDADGSFTITGAPAGSRVLSTRRLGYGPSRMTITVPASGDIT
jgi:hypothetical protein